MKQVHEKDIYVQFLGGASEVGATSIYIYWKGTKILIDSGKRREIEHPYPIFDEIEKDVDLFILTHLHQDHVGSLMECSEVLNLKKVLTSRENKTSLEAILKDSQKINSKSNSESLKEAYSDEKIENFIKKIEVLDYFKTKKFEDFDLTFYETSHLIGSLGLLIESLEYSLLVTSDFTESKKFFHPKTTFKENLKNKKIDTLITETTYGQNEQGDEVLKETCLNDLSYAINSIFKSENGNVLLPCFALGRMQEVLLAILKLLFSGRIDPDTKIYLNLSKNYEQNTYNSLGMKITEKYFSENFNEFKNEMPLDIQKFLENIDKNENILDYLLKNNRLNIENVGRNIIEKFKDSKKSIFIVQPGMIGSVNETQENRQGIGKLALEIASGTKHGLIFVGYQSQGTVGGEIKNTAYDEEIEIYGISATKKNRNIFNVTFPGHVSIKGVKDLIETLRPENVILVHGDIQASKSVAKSIKNRNILIPEIDEKLYLLDNGEKDFFSMQHKFSRIIIDLENEYRILNNKEILKSDEYEDYSIIKLMKDKSMNTVQNKLLHFEFLIKNERSIEFFEKLKFELRDKNISSNIRKFNKLDRITDVVADLISDTNEKANLYLLSYPFKKHKDFITLGQLADIDVYLKYENKFEKIPDLPFEINENIKTVSYERFQNLKVKNEKDELIEKLKYYRDVKTKKMKREIEEKYALRPEYDVNNKIYQKNIFYFEDRSLWGDIENIFGIKNKGVVKDIENIYNKLGEKIISIQMVNFVYTYNQNKEYREILGVDEKSIYGKYCLESGIQYFTINFRNNVIPIEEIEKIEIQVDL